MIEVVVNYCDELGCEEIRLLALNQAVKESYEQLGFNRTEPNLKEYIPMFLNFKESPFWKEKSKGEWRLARHINKGYVTSRLC